VCASRVGSDAGMPGVVIGHNDRIAWGFTNVGPDVQDLVCREVQSGQSETYQTPSGWQDAVIRREEIKVRKGFGSSEYDIVNHDVTVTRHGPIIFEGDGKRYALRWTALDPKKTIERLFYTAVNRARNWKEFNTALESFTGADAEHRLRRRRWPHRLSRRGRGSDRKSGDGSVPYDGSTDAGEWTSYIPIAKLPTLYDPPSGIIVTANQRIVGTDYPYFLTHSWAQPYRARRIFDLLNAKPKLSSEDFRRIQGDVYSIAGVSFTRKQSSCCDRS
jgi:penicillin amidase